MIPIRLELKNFLPYRVPDPLRFEGIHLACLTGSNGAGKSSLLDAITWALWGRARAKRDDELVHLGQQDMHVQLDFEQEGVMWRVLRRRSAGKRGQGALDLFILQEEGRRSIQSEPSMRATQDKINRILRLDYETFIHSAFLQQGKADAFTNLNPARRKQILSDILGLDQWARYEDIVKDRLKGIAQQIHYCDTRIHEIDDELAKRPGLEAQLVEATETHTTAQSAREAAEVRLKEVEGAPKELRNAKTNREERVSRRKDQQRELDDVTGQIERQRDQIADYAQVIDMQEEIEAGYAALQAARDTDDSLNEKFRALRSIDDRRYELQSQLDTAKARLESETESLARNIAELESAAENDHSTDFETVQQTVSELQALEAERQHIDGEAQQLAEHLAGFKTLRQTLTAEGQAVRDRLERLEAADDGAVCPLCGQDLDTEHRAKLVEELGTEIETRREDYRNNEEKITETNAALKEHRAQIKKHDIELKRLPPLIERLGTLQAQIEAADQAANRLADERVRLETVQQELAEGTFAADVREALAAVATEQASVGYDESSHEDTRARIEEYRSYEQMQTRLQVALEGINGLRDIVAGAEARQARLQEAITTIDGEIATLEVDIERLRVLVEEYNTREMELNQQRTLERSAYERLVNAQQSLQALDQQATRKKELEERRDGLRADESLHNDLKKAFGKNGIPAMIIETAIPELESEANELLARMTDGRMHMRFNTQREKVTGGIAETLDIEIADELGTRSYEMYSGGEAFRINFAVRVALSKMLARRAGAHLRTLFIDEGFGTQDEVGRNKLVEAITAIQDDFDLILVITHIDELRDSFPVHIVVDKTASGSMMSVR